MRNHKDLIKAYLEYTDGQEAAEAIRKWSFISVLAAALERKVWLNRGYYTLYPNLYVFIIGKSGLVKKSVATGTAVELLYEVPDIKFMSDRLTSASLLAQLGNSQKRFIYKDEEIIQSPTFIYSSELAVFMSEVHGNIQELLTDFFDCKPYDSTKPWVYSTRNQGDIKIYGPCLNMLGASTMTWLKKFIPVTEMEGGFSSRILFVIQNEGAKPVAWPEMTEEKFNLKQRIIEDLIELSQLAGPFRVEESARQLFTTWYEDMMKYEMPKNAETRFCGYYGRKGDLMLKLAMIRSAATREDRVVTTSHLAWANTVLDEIEGPMKEAFQSFGTNPQGEVMYEMLNLIRSKGSAEQKYIKKAFGSKAEGSMIDSCLEDLVGMGCLGRNGTVYRFIDGSL